MKVLVVDDSATHRRALSLALSGVEGVSVVGTAVNGEEALAMVVTLEPDAITLDLEMPRMDGFAFLRLLMASKPLPVLVVSSRNGKQDVFRALELGALDFLVKPNAAGDEYIRLLRKDLVRGLQAAQYFRGRRRPFSDSAAAALLTQRVENTGEVLPSLPQRFVFIGASTGGPPALVELFARLEPNLPLAIVVAQHMPERFTTTFAERLNRLRSLRVQESSGSDFLQAGHAYLIAGGTSAEVVEDAQGIRLVATPTGDNRYVPSIDRLFSSAAQLGQRAVGVVLTGMGDDGARGALAIRARGGYILAENEDSAAIFSMPRASERIGAACAMLPIPEIAAAIVRFAKTPAGEPFSG